MNDARDSTHAARFVAEFAAGWQLQDPALFLAHFSNLMTPDVRLEQPLIPPCQGRAAFEREFGRLRRLAPDLRGEVNAWAGTDQRLFVALTLTGTLGRRPVSWQLIDEIVLDAAGRCQYRRSVFDPLPLVGALLSTPSAWAPLLRSGMLGGMLRSLFSGA